MAKTVREPIQVYLTAPERAALDEEAKRRGVSRSEALRQGIHALRDQGGAGELHDLVREGAVTPPSSERSDPPPAKPVAPLGELLRELDEDREDR